MKTIILFSLQLLCSISYCQIILKIDKSIKYQRIDGFGVMAENLPNWGGFKDMSPEYINMFVDDLGCTIFRTAIDGTMENTNDNNDPNLLDISRFNLGSASGCEGDYHIPLQYQITNLKALKAKVQANGDKPLFFSTVFSPPHWMKYVRCVSGTDPVWNRLVNTDDEVEKGGTAEAVKDRKDEFAEFCLGYLAIMKNAGIDIMALNIQNEPAFAQPFSSCVYTPKSYASTVGVVGKKFRDNGFNTKMLFTEDISDLGRYQQFIRAMTSNSASANFLDIAAIHSYAANAITPESGDATTWRSLETASRVKNPDRPFWQTETSGYPDTHEGGMSMAKAIFTALKYGKVNAWVFLGMTRPVRENNSEHESLVKVDGTKSDRYYAAKHFYRYVRPGAVQVEASQDNNNVMSIVFQHDSLKELTIVLINPSETNAQVVKIEPIQKSGFPSNFQTFLTTSNPSQKVKDNGLVNLGGTVNLPANSVMTLVGRNSSPEISTSTANQLANSQSKRALIYPNPAERGFYFVGRGAEAKPVELQIINVHGQVVKEFKYEMEGTELFIETEGLPQGFYLVKFLDLYSKVFVKN